jgi:phosphoribosylamine---glycine ligase
MKVLVVGGGGREHALAWKVRQSPRLRELLIAPGNPGTAALGRNVPVAADDVPGLVALAVAEAVDLVVVGPEVPLVLGLADACAAKGIRCWGPSKAAAQLEGSKVAMKEFLRRHNIPTASFRTFTRAADAHAHLDALLPPGPSHQGPWIVVKSDGLAAGKGVTVAKDPAEAHDAVTRIMERREFGAEAGRAVVIEDVLRGEEISVFAFCDGRNALLLDYVQDHKQVHDGDRGPNTGGMGAFSPVPALVTPRDEDDIVRRILYPTMSGLVREGRPYVGLLYMGLMLTDAGPKVVEYNVRFGDPECQALMLRLETDLLDVFEHSLDGTLDQMELAWRPGTAICVTLASGGYPGRYQVDVPISGLDRAGDAVVFQAGTRIAASGLVTAGGRVLSVCAHGADLDAARTTAYAACDAISYQGKHCRRDIGRRREARA